ncbi:MAG: GTPase HflX, partial [Neofamilia sp.]
MLQTRSETERVLLVGIDKNLLDEDIDSSMEELSELAKASGAEVIASVVQRKLSKDPRTLIGPGKAEEIYNYCEELDIDTVIFNEELSGSQIRNL